MVSRSNMKVVSLKRNCLLNHTYFNYNIQYRSILASKYSLFQLSLQEKIAIYNLKIKVSVNNNYIK